MKLLIKNGHVVDPASGRDGQYDVLVADGIIVQVQEHISEAADEVVDAAGKTVMPGFIDLHVHFREPGFEYKETIRSGSLAAARGGFTSVCPMPNTNPVIDNRYMVEYLKMKAERESVINIWPVGAITTGQAGNENADIEAMANAGAVAVSEDGKSVMNTDVYRQGMIMAEKAGIPVLAHCEDKILAGGGVMNAGIRAKQLGMEGISNAVEDVIVARDIIMAKETKVRLHLCHCSTKDSVALVKLAKQWGQPVTAEVCPHHFTLSDADIPRDDANYKMNPPLRSREDVQALKEGLCDNIMDVIATDHAPHGQEEKERSIREAPFGITGLETAFALVVTELVEQGYLSLTQLVEKMSKNPAAVIGIDRGSLGEGSAADIVIADLTAEYAIHCPDFVSMGKNSPFEGRKVRGRIERTYVAGRLAYCMEQ